MPKTTAYASLDVGTKRIGVAVADGDVRIAVPLETIEVDGTEVATIHRLLEQEHPQVLVVGYPRNQAGEPTLQTKVVEDFVALLGDLDVPVVYQDESLTSVLAEQQLQAHGRPYSKGDIDAQAAALILQDYLETHRA